MDSIAAATRTEILTGAGQALSHRFRKGVTLSSPRAVRDYLSVRTADKEYELFTVLFVDNRASAQETDQNVG